MVWRRVMCVGACILLAGCDDADDRVPEQAEPFELRLRGNVCESAVDYQAPEGTNLSLVLSGTGKLQTLLFADGAPVNPNNPEALIIGGIVLDTPAELRVGSLGMLSGGRLFAEGLGSLRRLDGPLDEQLLIDEYEPGRRIAGSATLRVSAFAEGYPADQSEECDGGEVELSFQGGFSLWDSGDGCFSPTQNLDRLETDFVTGCACDPEVDEAVCASVCIDGGSKPDCDSHAIALFCVDGQWSWGHDGPCGAP